MQRAPRPSPVELQLPLMYVAPNRSLTYGYAYADDLNGFDELRQAAEADGVSTKLVYAYSDPQTNRFFGTFVLDLTDAKVNLSQITRKLDSLRGVDVVSLGTPECGLASAEKSLLQAAGTPVIAIARAFIGGTYRRLVEAQGASMETQLFQAGDWAGRHGAAGLPPLVTGLGLQLSPQLICRHLRDLQAFGWASVVSLHADDQLSGEIVLSDDFEAAAWQGQASSAKCNWIRGFITGVLSSLEGKPFEVSETQCQARGDAHCRMVFKPSGS